MIQRSSFRMSADWHPTRFPGPSTTPQPGSDSTELVVNPWFVAYEPLLNATLLLHRSQAGPSAAASLLLLGC